MPLLLADRAVLSPRVPLLSARDAALAGIRLNKRDHYRVRSGIYAPRAAWEKLAPWQRYEVRVHAYLLVSPDAVLCLESAAVVHGIPLFGETRDIHVFDPARRTTRRFGDVVVHASVEEREIVHLGRIHATSALDTVVDLARVLPLAHALTAADATVSRAQGGILTVEQLRDRADAQCNRRGRARLRWVWARTNGLAESPLEVVSRAAIEWSGYEEPVQQPEFRYEGHTDRTDFGFASNRALAEADGWGKYELDDPERAQAHLANEKRREDRLRRNGHPFARWGPEAPFAVKPLCLALQGAGVEPVRAAQPALLATLRNNPRALPHVPRAEKGPASAEDPASAASAPSAPQHRR